MTIQFGSYDLEAMVHAMANAVTGVAVTDRPYRGQTFKHCFVASEAIDWMMLHAVPAPESRAHAVAIGTSMISRSYIRHVSKPETHTVLQDAFLFFRFQPEVPAVDGLVEVNGDKAVLKLRLVVDVLRNWRCGIVSKGRKKGLRRVLSFVAKEMVDWLVNNLGLKRVGAVGFGRFLESAGAIEPIKAKDTFADADECLYRWTDLVNDPSAIAPNMEIATNVFSERGAADLSRRSRVEHSESSSRRESLSGSVDASESEKPQLVRAQSQAGVVGTSDAREEHRGTLSHAQSTPIIERGVHAVDDDLGAYLDLTLADDEEYMDMTTMVDNRVGRAGYDDGEMPNPYDTSACPTDETRYDLVPPLPSNGVNAVAGPAYAKVPVQSHDSPPFGGLDSTDNAVLRGSRAYDELPSDMAATPRSSPLPYSHMPRRPSTTVLETYSDVPPPATDDENDAC